MNKKAEGEWGAFILATLVMFIITILYFNWSLGLACHISSIGADKYCVDVANMTFDHQWEVRSHQEDATNAENARAARQRIDEAQINKVACYNAGYDYSESFDIFDDYNLTCRRIAYLNDHLMDNFEQRDGGYISGSYSGFLSSGHVEGKSYEYVNERIMATGKLIKRIEYHVDCENSTNKFTLTHDYYHDGWYFQPEDTTKIDYFTEEEFVMTYVDRCIK